MARRGGGGGARVAPPARVAAHVHPAPPLRMAPVPRGAVPISHRPAAGGGHCPRAYLGGWRARGGGGGGRGGRGGQGGQGGGGGGRGGGRGEGRGGWCSRVARRRGRHRSGCGGRGRECERHPGGRVRAQPRFGDIAGAPPRAPRALPPLGARLARSSDGRVARVAASAGGVDRPQGGGERAGCCDGPQRERAGCCDRPQRERAGGGGRCRRLSSLGGSRCSQRRVAARVAYPLARALGWLLSVSDRRRHRRRRGSMGASSPE